jgi:hypothetical protein
LAAKGVLHYLFGTTEPRLIFEGHKVLISKNFCDADYLGDESMQQSTAAYVYTAGGSIIN